MVYTPFEPDSIKPAGWIKRQLEIQAEGLAGNLHKVWPDVRDSAWIGGDREGWERVPYWLDGFIPLAFLLGDEEKKQVAERYIHSIIQRQEEDGWICPCSAEQRSTYDVWAFFLIGKVLALYHDFTQSELAENALYRAMKCLYRLLEDGTIRLFDWGRARWFECLIPIAHLYKTRKEAWLISLAAILREQGTDWSALCERWVRPLNVWTYETHIVNIAMMLKYEVLCRELFGGEYQNVAEQLWQHLYRHHGNVAGAINGDECLAGLAANRGFELCSVVELMYSLEILYAATGDCLWAQRLERVAFNALPAALSDDMWAHQYDQMTNQIACFAHPGKPLYGTNSSDANRFGLEPNFGCCTANFGQGWPKLLMNVFLKSENGIVAAMLLPAELTTEIKGVKVSIRALSEYPFRHNCRYIVQTEAPVEFELRIRIPGWAKNLTVHSGDAVYEKDYVVFNQRFHGTWEVGLSFTDTVRLQPRPYNLMAVEYGALVYALPVEAEITRIEYTKDGVERKFPYCDYEYLPRSEWRYAFASPTFSVREHGVSDVPFSSERPPVTITTSLCRVDWEFAEGYENICERRPVSAKAAAPAEEKQLVPYGCAKLRMTEMPIAEEG